MCKLISEELKKLKSRRNSLGLFYYFRPFSGKIILILFLLISEGCKERVFNPKPRTYPRVDLPAKKYGLSSPENCPFEFKIPVYATYEKDSTFFDTLAEPCWFNIKFESLNAKVYCTYKHLENQKELGKSVEDSYKFVKDHLLKADYIDEFPVKKSNGVSGIIYEIEGSTATPFQFYLTDSLQHFLRGALYFNSHIDQDSLKPYYDFVKEDIIEMVNSFNWK